ncbi:hypothetical protein NEDG_00008 [Nematocida displodere]|uniref:Uncharacterized protein n=1 Tax=Nematocida displodere TaxID=1805483 RepID=A0A177EHS7_9MICR|nr:hypothetical protein NEDG_00008 [Nematocida displodere]
MQERRKMHGEREKENITQSVVLEEENQNNKICEETSANDGSIQVFKNQKGEKTFKIRNLIGMIKNEQAALMDLVSVKHMHKEPHTHRTPRVSGRVTDNCMLCDKDLQEDTLTVFCSTCLIMEDEMSVTNIQKYL